MTILLNAARLGWENAVPKTNVVLLDSSVEEISATQDKSKAEIEIYCGKSLLCPCLAMTSSPVHDMFTLLKLFLKH